MINAIGIPLLDDTKKIDRRNDALMRAAALYQVPIYIYSLRDIKSYLESGTIMALHWENGEYRECLIDLPKYTEIYCTVNELFERFPKEIQWLFANTVFTDHYGLVKFELQRKLLFSNLSQYAIPTFAIHSYAELIATVPMFPASFLKPWGGKKSLGVMRIDIGSDGIRYSVPGKTGILTQEVFSRYYSEANFDEKTVWMLEPCLNILNNDGHAVDFRCLVSLDGEGKWKNVITYGRIGGNGVASNISCGGTFNSALDILEEMLPDQGREKLKEINSVALQIAAFVQKESKYPVSWLGLDMCVDRPSNQIYVIEANSKPATKLVGCWELAMVRAQYFTYLLKLPKKEVSAQ